MIGPNRLLASARVTAARRHRTGRSSLAQHTDTGKCQQCGTKRAFAAWGVNVRINQIYLRYVARTFEVVGPCGTVC